MTKNINLNRREFTTKSAMGALGVAIGCSMTSRSHAATNELAMSWAEWGKLDATAPIPGLRRPQPCFAENRIT